MVRFDRPFLFVTDIDGTLLSNRKDSSTLTNKIIAKAIKYKNGRIFKFALASGRAPQHTYKVIETLGLVKKDIFTISCNGAVVQKTKTKETLLHLFFQKEILKKISDIYKNHPKGTKYSSFSTLEESYRICDDKIIRTYESWIDYSTIYIKNIDEILEKKISKVATFSFYKSHSRAILKSLKDALGDSVIINPFQERIIEITPKNANKLEGVKILQQHLRIPDNQVIAVGDNDNDVKMLQYFDNSYAVKNASKQALKAAKTILGRTNKEDAIAHLILEIMN